MPNEPTVSDLRQSFCSADEAEDEPELESDYTNFVDHQIENLVSETRSQNPGCTRVDELNVAIMYCKTYLMETVDGGDREKRSQVMGKLVDLKLELDQVEEQIQRGENVEQVVRHRGHEFVLQSNNGRNPYCEICVSTIWRLAQHWRRCRVCGLRTHDKCITDVKRACVGLKARRDNFKLNLSLCPESGLMAQTYKCAECLSPIGFGRGPELEPRICDYTGKYYCKKCHWNDEMVIPARVVRNWDCTKRPVCRASKQLLSLVEQKPIINLTRDNPALFRYVGALQKMQKLRSTIIFMKCYFVCCRTARKLRILQYLNKYQHFVDTENMYSLADLIQIATGTIVQETEQVVRIFREHITKDCEICQGNAFVCELCDDERVIYPFDDGVSICKQCFACFHRPCFCRSSKRCPRCKRRKARKAVMSLEEVDQEYEDMKDQTLGDKVAMFSLDDQPASSFGEEHDAAYAPEELSKTEDFEHSNVSEGESQSQVEKGQNVELTQEFLKKSSSELNEKNAVLEEEKLKRETREVELEDIAGTSLADELKLADFGLEEH